MCPDCGEPLDSAGDHEEGAINDGCDALLGWLDDQNLDPFIAIPVLAKTILVIIHMIDADDPKRIKQGQNAVAKMIRDGLVPN